MKQPPIRTKLIEMAACPEAITWMGQRRSVTRAWQQCERADWMLWLVAELDIAPAERRAIAREIALSVIDLWDAPDVVREYLETGDEALREASCAARRVNRAVNWTSSASWAARRASWAASWAASEASREASEASWAASRAASEASRAAGGATHQPQHADIVRKHISANLVAKAFKNWPKQDTNT